MTLETDELISRHARMALVTVAVLCGTTFVSSALLPFEGAITGQGTVVIDGNVKKVQHQFGGSIGAILVKEGVPVREGDVVARLDDTTTRSNLGIVMADLNAQTARAGRLAAERDDRAVVTFPPELHARASNDASVVTAIASESRLFETRRAAREGTKAQLRERFGQIEKEIESVRQQLAATEQQQKIAYADRAMLEPLIRQGLVQRPRVTQLDREIERNKGLIGDSQARIEQSNLRLRETEVQIAQVDRERVADAMKDLREAEARMAELTEKRTAAEDQLRKIDIKATASGVVHELAVHTVGGVINPGETLMSIVPNPESLIVEVKVAPTERDQIIEQKEARVRFTAFNQRVTPELKATVQRVSPNTSRDQQTGATYYTVGLRLLDGQLDLLRGQRLMPGMLADAFITTDQRTLLGFLTKQFRDYWSTTFLGR